MGEPLRTNGGRLWDSLMEMAQIGATDKGGVCRLSLTEDDRLGRDLFVGWCREAGLAVTVDGIGNIFARRPGKQESLPPVVMGSHLDSQPTGGKFDGVYGVLAGLEAVRTLNDQGIETAAAIEVASWTNEEGVRFAPAMFGSGVFGGVFDLDFALSRTDSSGVTVAEALAEIGYAGPAAASGRQIAAHLEVHIEQGPVLESEAKTIGVVTGVQGMNWYDLVVTGGESHAGTTPMNARRDALRCAMGLIEEFYALAARAPPEARLTAARLTSSPASRNTVPGRVTCGIDLRHPDGDVLERLDREFHEAAAAVPDGFAAELSGVWASPPARFHEMCVGAIAKAAESLGFGHREMVSGAGHDSVYTSRVAPTGMIFVPCAGGLSHNEAESAEPSDLAAGCDVLLNSAMALAG